MRKITVNRCKWIISNISFSDKNINIECKNDVITYKNNSYIYYIWCPFCGKKIEKIYRMERK